MLFRTIIAFIFGTCVGSFLNVCIYRLPKVKSIITHNKGGLEFPKGADFSEANYRKDAIFNPEAQTRGENVEARAKSKADKPAGNKAYPIKHLST